MNTAPCMDYRANSVLKSGGQPQKTAEWKTLPFREPREAYSAKNDGNLPNVNGKHLAAGTRINADRALSSLNHPQQSHEIPVKHHGLPFSSGEFSAINATLKPHERLQNRSSSMGVSQNFSRSHSAPQNRRESMSDGRCSSLSTAVVDTSEKCELVIVEGQNVRRRENTNPCAEIPQLHVVKCKNSTAFRLVSPKINRRKMAIPGTEGLSCFMFYLHFITVDNQTEVSLPQLYYSKIHPLFTDGAQPVGSSITSRTGHETENPSQTNPPPAAEPQRISQPTSTRPRPDHLPLGSPDPRAHPLYLGVGSLTGT